MHIHKHFVYICMDNRQNPVLWHSFIHKLSSHSRENITSLTIYSRAPNNLVEIRILKTLSALYLQPNLVTHPIKHILEIKNLTPTPQCILMQTIAKNVTNLIMWCTNKNNVQFDLRAKYVSLVWPVVEYACAAWDPHTTEDIKTI